MYIGLQYAGNVYVCMQHHVHWNACIYSIHIPASLAFYSHVLSGNSLAAHKCGWIIVAQYCSNVEKKFPSRRGYCSRHCHTVSQQISPQFPGIIPSFLKGIANMIICKLGVGSLWNPPLTHVSEHGALLRCHWYSLKSHAFHSRLQFCFSCGDTVIWGVFQPGTVVDECASSKSSR